MNAMVMSPSMPARTRERTDQPRREALGRGRATPSVTGGVDPAWLVVNVNVVVVVVVVIIVVGP